MSVPIELCGRRTGLPIAQVGNETGITPRDCTRVTCRASRRRRPSARGSRRSTRRGGRRGWPRGGNYRAIGLTLVPARFSRRAGKTVMTGCSTTVTTIIRIRPRCSAVVVIGAGQWAIAVVLASGSAVRIAGATVSELRTTVTRVWAWVGGTAGTLTVGSVELVG